MNKRAIKVQQSKFTTGVGKKILRMNILVETDQVEQGVAHRAARLYRFDRRQYQARVRDGFHFEV